MAHIIALEVSKCVGCHSCEIACALAHSTVESLSDAAMQQPAPQSRITVAAVGDIPIPVQCRQCETPICVDKCPKDALSKSEFEGVVTVDEEACIACRVCIKVCPIGQFGAIRLSRDEDYVVKCDLCAERREQGLEPACVEACPTGALLLMDLEEAVAAGLRVTAEELAEALAGQPQAASGD